MHVLTLTATPIPRTLQLALSGVRDLSLITTPPIDRLAVRTFVTPFDPLVVREALLREHYRGGQSFYVAPRIADLREAEEFLKDTVPEVKAAVAHGQMAATVLEDVMTAFYERKIDVLVSTNIVESGLDIPTANTMIVHRADMFGLSQLYQLRGRIGRAKQRAYAYLTTPPDRKLKDTASAGSRCCSRSTSWARASRSPATISTFAAPAICSATSSPAMSAKWASSFIRRCSKKPSRRCAWAKARRRSPTNGRRRSISARRCLFPNPMSPTSMSACRSIAGSPAIESREDIDRFAAELIDRFGALPEEVKHLLDIVAIKQLCRIALVEKIDAGPKGGTHRLPQQQVPQSARAGEAHQRAFRHDEGAARPEGGRCARLAVAGIAAEWRQEPDGPARKAGG